MQLSLDLPEEGEEADKEVEEEEVDTAADCRCRLTRPSVGQSVESVVSRDCSESVADCNLRFLQSES